MTSTRMSIDRIKEYERMDQRTDLLKVLNHIDPSELCYQDWVNVGMALKEEGYDTADWDAWSAKDPGRYHANECYQKWVTFRGTGVPVTGGTIVQLARDQGWVPEYDPGHEIGWEDEISGDKDNLVIINKNWVEDKEIEAPSETWNPIADLITYIGTLFEASDNVGYVTESWQNEDGKYLPTRGSYDRTAGQLIEQLSKCKGDLGKVLGDYKEEAGAWIRFNPLDGKGCKNENVTDYRYALVESDDMEIEKQNAILRDLELPIACLVHSGKRSLHAIVKVDAIDYKEYQKRVDYLYDVCKRNGISIDRQNRNPSRLSRMPGITRNGQKQFLIDTNIGKDSWMEWVDWIESVNDDLPDPESLDSLLNNLPELSPSLIGGVLRQGHKMLLAGPSKAGKSFLQIGLCISIAEGIDWLKWHCAQGKVLYVNLELDRASCLHRFADVYKRMGLRPVNASNIDIWNLRGKSVPMDKLAPKLIRRAAKKNYIAIVIDPIYKVITGDENSADQMAAFCNQFDKVCTELGAAVIYCHHHSKGSQGSKRSMDRSSGSGVFARDPDALLDLIELEVSEDIRTQEENKAVCRACIDWLNLNNIDWDEDLSQDDELNSRTMMEYCEKKRYFAKLGDLDKAINEAKEAVKIMTAWRLEGTLREFPKFDPVNIWFDYPVHCMDKSGALNDIKPECEMTGRERSMKNLGRKKTPKEREQERKDSFEEAISSANLGEPVTIEILSEYLGVSEKTVRRRVKEHGGYAIIKDEIKRLDRDKTDNNE